MEPLFSYHGFFLINIIKEANFNRYRITDAALWTIPLKEVASSLRNFFRDPLRP